MRILLTVHHWLDARAGVSGATLSLAQAYRDLGHEAAVVSWSDMPHRFTRRTFELGWYVWLAGHLARRVAAQAIDVVDCVSADAAAWATIRARAAPRSLLATRTHGLEHVYHQAKDRERALGHDSTTRLNRWHEAGDRALVGRALRAGDLALFLNEGDRQFAVTRLGVRPERARVVRNGLDSGLLGGLPPQPRPDQSPRIVWVGAFEVRKGAPYAVQALGSVLRSRPETRVAILGTHQPPDAIRARFEPEVRAQLEVVPSFEREALPALLREADVLLFPSVAEGFGLALLEAMACGLAPVASDTGAVGTIVGDQRDGLLVPPGDAAALARALERVLGDRGELDRMRRSAYERAQGFTWRRAAEENLAAYEEAAARRAR